MLYQRQQTLFLFPLLLSIFCIIYISRHSIHQHILPVLSARQQEEDSKQDSIQVNVEKEKDDIKRVNSERSTENSAEELTSLNGTVNKPNAESGTTFNVSAIWNDTLMKNQQRGESIRIEEPSTEFLNGNTTNANLSMSLQSTLLTAKDDHSQQHSGSISPIKKISIIQNNNCLPSINNIGSEINISSQCTPFYNITDICKVWKYYYNKEKLRKQRGCPISRSAPICTLARTSGFPRFRVSCNMDSCKGSVSIKTVDFRYGVVRGKKTFKNIRELKKGVMKAVAYCQHHGFDFLILSCRNRIESTVNLQQILFLPPNIESEAVTPRSQADEIKKGKKREAAENTKKAKGKDIINTKPNINIVVLDSLSRSHFLRILPRTVSEMMKINSAGNTHTKILDYELFQSLAPFTFPNVQSFMAGKQDYVDIRTRKIDFSVLLKRFNDASYQTMMQEDACWYDKWGTLMTSNRKRERSIKYSHELKREWKLLQEEKRAQFADSYGLSHFSCFVLGQHGKTNIFNSGDFCFDGKPLSAHYLDYAAEILKTQESIAGLKPQFTYTHLNIAHEITGKRVKSIDEYLRDFLRQMSLLNNTLTILWSDHGGKTTKYAVRTLAGKFEIYDAFLFIAIPENILEKLGGTARRNLLKNQRAILTAQDLHRSMIFLSNWNNVIENGDENTDQGLFTDQTSRTGCDSLPVRQNALCKCSKKYEIIDLSDKKNYYDVLWMSEFATGELNNLLNKELNIKKEQYQRPRSCRWIQGVSYRDVIRENKQTSTRYVFDVLVNHTKIQVFNIQILYAKSQLKLIGWQRTSIYRSFDTCKDRNAPIELCVCSRKSKQKSHFEPDLYSGAFGGVNTLSNFAGNACLVVVVRKHYDEVKTYLIANVCKSKQSVNAFQIHGDGWVSSNSLPRTVTIVGLTTTFITAARRRKKSAAEFTMGFE